VFFINGAGIGQHISQFLRFLNDYCFGSIKDIHCLDEKRFNGILNQIRRCAVSGTASNIFPVIPPDHFPARFIRMPNLMVVITAAVAADYP
jgi:hypothetical protein